MQLGLQQKLETCKSLPSMPAVAVHVMRLCQRENFDIADVARAIGGDPALTAKLVALINSPLFAMRQEVRTVSQALVLLGVNAIRTLALSFAVVGDLRARERVGVDRRAYWRRAIFAAAVAQELARAQGMRQPADVFLAALLQDVGELALDQAANDIYQPLVAQAGADHDKLVDLEKRAFGCDHAEVGRWLMTQWRLPEIVRAAVGSSHDPSRWQRGADLATETTVKIVALSGTLADLWVMTGLGRSARRARDQARELAGLEEDQLATLMRRVNRAVVEIAPLFNLQVGEVEDLDLIVERVEAAWAQPEAELDGVSSVGTLGASIEEAPRLDPLTGLAGRARFDTYLAEQFEGAKTVGKPLSVVLFDPDHLEMINQTFGREAGDRALRALGKLVGERLRYHDLAARYGGEELALVLTDTHAAGAAVVAERLRKKIEDAQHDIGIGDPVRITVSASCVTLDDALAFPGGPLEMLRAAEQTLTRAKQAGRNRVLSFEALPGGPSS